jgi:hypothetical protein
MLVKAVLSGCSPALTIVLLESTFNTGVLQHRSMLDPQPPRLLDQVRQFMRLRLYSLKTEKAYVHYIRAFVLFHNKVTLDDRVGRLPYAAKGRFLTPLPAARWGLGSNGTINALNAPVLLQPEKTLASSSIHKCLEPR